MSMSPVPVTPSPTREAVASGETAAAERVGTAAKSRRSAADDRPETEILADTRPFTGAYPAVAAGQLFSTLGSVAVLLWLIAVLPAIWVWAPLIPLTGVLVRVFVLQHDAGHQSLFSGRTSNHVVGTFLSFLTGVSYEAWRTEHAWHHNHQGKLSRRGVDRMNSPMTVEEAKANAANARLRVQKISFLNIFFLGALSLLILRKDSSGFFQFRPSFRWPFQGRDRMRRGLWISNVGHVLFHLIGVMLLRERWLPVLGAMWTAAGLGSSLFWVQHNFEHSWHAEDEAWSYTRVAIDGSSYLRMGPLLRWFTASIGLHHVHHLNPGIPNYRLEEARLAIPELARVAPLSPEDLRRCYTHVFWDGDQDQMVLPPDSGN